MLMTRIALCQSYNKYFGTEKGIGKRGKFLNYNAHGLDGYTKSRIQQEDSEGQIKKLAQGNRLFSILVGKLTGKRHSL